MSSVLPSGRKTALGGGNGDWNAGNGYCSSPLTIFRMITGANKVLLLTVANALPSSVGETCSTTSLGLKYLCQTTLPAFKSHNRTGSSPVEYHDTCRSAG